MPGPLAAARLPVAAIAAGTVAAATLAAADLAAARGTPAAARLDVDLARTATAFTSERHLRAEGRGFAGFAALSRFWPAADGWVRTHANYPHHRERLLWALGVTGEDEVPNRIAALDASTVEDRVTAENGLAVAVRTAQAWAAHPHGRAVAGQPLLRLRRVVEEHGGALPPMPAGVLLPAAGVRVLDLTRVIAGPVGTRTLALLGADVLRVDPPGLPELPGQYLDTGFGKRSTVLDLTDPRDRATFEDLLSAAHVVVTGYRPGALDRFGLSPAALLDRRPALVVATISAWGTEGPWAGRRGFDSLVQAATGIATAEGAPYDAAKGGLPGALPAQALDHGTGYLLAAAVLRALALRAVTGGGWLAELSLARAAHWLLTTPPAAVPTEAAGDEPNRWCTRTGPYRHALPPVTLPGGPETWAEPPHAWGSDAPAWRARSAQAGERGAR
ncbi:CoA transferase [Rhizomonospora bruguierae]|uniref:CoA transferase n=1 Tax=Rhizomonospora bruguierae TaxID=1581705 RepID=UPI001BCB0DF9|nr:CoA transferase [Micromonospora sp. NBRC 107566]